MEVEITEVRSEPLVRLIRVWLVLGLARLLRVPVAIRDEHRGATPGATSAIVG